jgi:hypothetical protein
MMMLPTLLLAGEAAPRFVFYSSVVYDPNNSIENWDGVYTVKYPITTAVPSTGKGELQYPTLDILPDTLVYPTTRSAGNNTYIQVETS